MNWTVYILKCSDGKFYTGFTNNLQRRLKEHREGKSFYTSYRLPFNWQLILFLQIGKKHMLLKNI
nr:GIY-YIG nuclease family protein [uncultured Allomuricauda sp.]